MHRPFALLMDFFQKVAPCTSPCCSLCVSANAVLEGCDISAAITTILHQFAVGPMSKVVGDNAIDTDMFSNQLTLDLRNVRPTCPHHGVSSLLVQLRPKVSVWVPTGRVPIQSSSPSIGFWSSQLCRIEVSHSLINHR